jgi:hypothetical protein
VEWFPFSIVATVVVSGGALIVGEALARGAKRADDAVRAALRPQLGRLRWATALVLCAFAVWFLVDHPAIAAGRRPFHVAIANLVAFGLLFATCVGPLMRTLEQGQPVAARGAPVRPRHTIIRHAPAGTLLASHTFVAILLSLALASWWDSTNDAGYRLKGLLLIVVGAAFYLLGLQRPIRPPAMAPHASRALLVALAYFVVAEAAAILTLTLDFANGAERALGVGAQLTAGVVGLIACARMIGEPSA